MTPPTPRRRPLGQGPPLPTPDGPAPTEAAPAGEGAPAGEAAGVSAAEPTPTSGRAASPAGEAAAEAAPAGPAAAEAAGASPVASGGGAVRESGGVAADMSGRAVAGAATAARLGAEVAAFGGDAANESGGVAPRSPAGDGVNSRAGRLDGRSAGGAGGVAPGGEAAALVASGGGAGGTAPAEAGGAGGTAPAGEAAGALPAVSGGGVPADSGAADAGGESRSALSGGAAAASSEGGPDERGRFPGVAERPGAASGTPGGEAARAPAGRAGDVADSGGVAPPGQGSGEAANSPAGRATAPSDGGAVATAGDGSTETPAGQVPVEDGRFRVVLENFEGPFDLLLQLISRHRLDVTEVALSRVTDDFLAHLRAMGPDGDLDQTTEFLVVAATLLDLKAARLLPTAEVEDEADLALLEARDLLFARLLQYRAFKRVAEIFAARLADEALRRPRTVGLEPHHAELLPDVVISIGPEGFARLAVQAMQPKPRPEVYVEHIHAPLVSVREQAEVVIGRLREVGSATFAELVGDAPDTLTVVARFLALLELYRERAVALEQEEALGPLLVRWSGAEPGRTLVSDEFDQVATAEEADEGRGGRPRRAAAPEPAVPQASPSEGGPR